MRRRTVLASVASFATLGGCSRVFGSNQVRVRVMRVGEERIESADARCTLSESFVADNPVLERLLKAAQNAPTGEWVTTGTDRETGDVLLTAIEQQCDQQDGVSDERSESEARRGAKWNDGVYQFGDEAFLVDVRANTNES